PRDTLPRQDLVVRGPLELQSRPPTEALCHGDTAMSALVRRQSGFSLVELMIAMTLGLILSVIIGNVFLGAKESYRTTEDLSRLQENARFAVTHLGRIIRMASYVSNPVNIAATRAATFPPLAPAITGTEGGG